ncbi:MAG: serine kinase, partial [Planctomycetota bacterium]
MAGDPFPAVNVEPALTAGYVTNDALPQYVRSLLDAAVSTDSTWLEHRRFQLPRLGLNVWFASPEFRRLCEAGILETDDPQTLSDATIYALHAEPGRWPAPLQWHGAADVTGRVFDRTLSDRGLRGCHYGYCWKIYDPAARIGVQSLASPRAIPPWETASPLQVFMHWAYAAAGLRLTHAAALGQGGVGALLVGAGGSGKSGTTRAGLLHGLER